MVFGLVIYLTSPILMNITKSLSVFASRSLIAELCDSYGSDKGTATGNNRFVSGWQYHDYASIYEMFFGSIRFEVKSVLEVGIGTNDPEIPSSMGVTGSPGASLRVWEDYFPDAEVIGIDIDDKILFKEGRITTFQCDQTDPISIGKFFKNCHVKSFDIIIDDGLHTQEAASVFFENAWGRLEPYGMYFIEDAAWWNGGEIDFLEDKKVKYFCFSDLVKTGVETPTNSQWNKLILILKC